MALNTPPQVLDNTDDTSNATAKGVQASTAYSGLVTFQVVGAAAGSAVLTAQGTVDGTNYVTIGVVPVNSTTMATTISTDNIFRADASGLVNFRVAVTTAGTGTSTITFFTSEG